MSGFKLTLRSERLIVRDLHINFGHPTAVTLQRILRRQGAKPEAIRAAGLMACDSCGESIRRKRPRPVRLPNQYEFNRHLLLDTMFAKDACGTTFGFLNIIDDATGFQVVACFGELQGPPASRAVLRYFTTSWSSWAGLPFFPFRWTLAKSTWPTLRITSSSLALNKRSCHLKHHGKAANVRRPATCGKTFGSKLSWSPRSLAWMMFCLLPPSSLRRGIPFQGQVATARSNGSLVFLNYVSLAHFSMRQKPNNWKCLRLLKTPQARWLALSTSGRMPRLPRSAWTPTLVSEEHCFDSQRLCVALSLLAPTSTFSECSSSLVLQDSTVGLAQAESLALSCGTHVALKTRMSLQRVARHTHTGSDMVQVWF